MEVEEVGLSATANCKEGRCGRSVGGWSSLT